MLPAHFVGILVELETDLNSDQNFLVLDFIRLGNACKNSFRFRDTSDLQARRR